MTITNTGDQPATGITAAISGAQETQFSETDNCSTLAVAAKCTVTVTYAPTATGTAAATLTVSSPDVASPVTVALKGKGTVTKADLRTKISGPGHPASGSTVAYTVSEELVGPGSTSATVTATLPNGLGYQGINRTGCQTPAVGDSGAITCPNIAISGGHRVTLKITVRVSAKTRTRLTLTAKASGANTVDPTPGNATAKLSITVGRGLLSTRDAYIANRSGKTLKILRAGYLGRAGHGLIMQSDTRSRAGDAQVRYQWLLNGKPIPGATHVSYIPPRSYVGKWLRVRVVATERGYASWRSLSPRVCIAQPKLAAARAAITNRLGHTLNAIQVGERGLTWHGSFVEAGTRTRIYAVQLHYQWLANGKPIPGATHATYVPSRQYARQWLRVRITATKAGFADWSSLSRRVYIFRSF